MNAEHKTASAFIAFVEDYKRKKEKLRSLRSLTHPTFYQKQEITALTYEVSQREKAFDQLLAEKKVVGRTFNIPENASHCYEVHQGFYTGEHSLTVQRKVNVMNVEVLNIIRVSSDGSKHPPGTYLFFEDEDETLLAVLIDNELLEATKGEKE